MKPQNFQLKDRQVIERFIKYRQENPHIKAPPQFLLEQLGIWRRAFRALHRALSQISCALYRAAWESLRSRSRL